MEDIEIQIFEEINDYKEKIGIMTFRQWIFAALLLLLVIPTYILLPKYTFINSDIASYIVIIEAGIVGFIGFVKIHNLSAEKIIPYWYRHYFAFNKPLKYMTMKEYERQQEEKKNKNKKNKAKIVATANSDDSELTPKQLKQKEKQKRELERAKKKYGYLFKEETDVVVINPKEEYQEMSQNLPKVETNEDKYRNPFEIKPTEDTEPVTINVIKEHQELDKESENIINDSDKTNLPNKVEQEESQDDALLMDEGYKIINSMTEEERKALVKLLELGKK